MWPQQSANTDLRHTLDIQQQGPILAHAFPLTYRGHDSDYTP